MREAAAVTSSTQDEVAKQAEAHVEPARVRCCCEGWPAETFWGKGVGLLGTGLKTRALVTPGSGSSTGENNVTDSDMESLRKTSMRRLPVCTLCIGDS